MSVITSRPQRHRPPPRPAPRDVSKFYGTGDAAVAALDNVSVGLAEGEFTAIMGPSGSGKSTLLHMLAGLDRPTSGEVYLGDTEITSLNDKALTLLRRDRIGFIFQSFNLLPTMTAAENIVLPMRIAGRKPDEHWVASIVETVGLTGRLGAPSRRSSPVASSSASPRPGRWRRGRRSSSPTSPPAPSTRGRAPSCSGSSATAVDRARPDRRHGHPRRRPRPATPTASSSSPTATSSTRCTPPPPTRSSTT